MFLEEGGRSFATAPGQQRRRGAHSRGSSDSGCPTDIGIVRSARDAEAAELTGLLARTAAGDTAAFAELYDKTSSRVYGMVLRVIRDSGFAEETTQEVFLQVWRTADKFDPTKGSAVSWLMVLAQRRAIDRVRTEQSNTDREVTYEVNNHRDEFDQVTEEVWRRIEQQAVLDCLDRLTDAQREAVALAYYGGLSYRETAVSLGVALPTVKSRIRDGLIRLRACLGVI